MVAVPHSFATQRILRIKDGRIGMAELEKIAYAKNYIEKLANGINPVTNQAIPDADVINTVKISLCLFYVSALFRIVIAKEGIYQPKATRVMQPFTLDYEARTKVPHAAFHILSGAIHTSSTSLT